jgi:hypothetical protein
VVLRTDVPEDVAMINNLNTSKFIGRLLNLCLCQSVNLQLHPFVTLSIIREYQSCRA